MSTSCDDDDDDNDVVFLSLNSVQFSLTLTQTKPELEWPPKIYRKDSKLDAAQLFTIVCVKHQLCLFVQTLAVFCFFRFLLFFWCAGRLKMTEMFYATMSRDCRRLMPNWCCDLRFCWQNAEFRMEEDSRHVCVSIFLQPDTKNLLWAICATSVEFGHGASWVVVSEVCLCALYVSKNTKKKKQNKKNPRKDN